MLEKNVEKTAELRGGCWRFLSKSELTGAPKQREKNQIGHKLKRRKRVSASSFCNFKALASRERKKMLIIKSGGRKASKRGCRQE
ncbi:CLUMA_CG009185, isoform A [Clunio marinus]|uniref:CLUMA_CG009185, isoform A n=1 Tax=Clunio marinus TaxID=568069 RepID=A0A1J1I636_9DIPT|nr:CLUMA_CG009185, isoform A [Clunio marinus]